MLSWPIVYLKLKQLTIMSFLEKPLIAKNRVFANVGYEFNGEKFDYTITYGGKKRLPSTALNPGEYYSILKKNSEFNLQFFFFLKTHQNSLNLTSLYTPLFKVVQFR